MICHKNILQFHETRHRALGTEHVLPRDTCAFFLFKGEIHLKTQYELTYEKLVTAMILSDDNPIHNQLDLFMDFHRNSSSYYDLFCDSLYKLSCGRSKHPLWITPSGKSYLAHKQLSDDDRKLLTFEQIPYFEDDLEEQLETALASLERLTQ